MKAILFTRQIPELEFSQQLEWLLTASQQVAGQIERIYAPAISEEGEKYFENQVFDAQKWEAYQAQGEYPLLYSQHFEFSSISIFRSMEMLPTALEAGLDPYQVVEKMEALARWTDAKWPDQFHVARISTFDEGFVQLRRQQDSTYARDTGWSMWGWPSNFWVGGPLAYIHIFSKHFYTEFASREEMLALPAVRVEELPTGSILLQIYPDAHDPISALHAGRAFYEQVGQLTLTPQRKVLSISQRLKLE